MTIKQTAGHDALGEFAPEFAHLNDEVLFGEVWNRDDKLPLKLRSIVTVSALIGKGIVDSSLKYHLQSARNNGVTKSEMAEILTHIAFYAGWPNAWAAFHMAKEVYADDATEAEGHGGFFGLGEPNDAFAQYFIGQSYLKSLTGPDDYLPIHNVTFEPGCRNNWHVHHATSRRRPGAHLRRGRGLVPGGGQARAQPQARRRRGDPGKRQALARRQGRLLVQSPRIRLPR